MTRLPLRFDRPVTLVGGGALDGAMLAEARALAPGLVAADGAADWLLGQGIRPDAVIGDMDSIRSPDRMPEATRVVHLAEQDSTDFEKCLYATEAPFYLAVGFTGRRVDHMLAVFNAMLRLADKRVVLLGEEEVMALAPPGRVLALCTGAGARVSIFPLAEVTGIRSVGLEWPVAGLTMAPGGRIGTSNRAALDRIEIGFDRPGALVMLERPALGELVRAVVPG